MALFGVLIGLWLGQKRWKAEQEQKARATYEDNLRSTYLALWDVVEDTHLKMRTALEDPKLADFDALVEEANNFMIRKGLFIKASDRALVLDYLLTTHQFFRALITAKGGHPETANIETFESEVAVLEQLGRRTDRLRNDLQTRILKILGADALQQPAALFGDPAPLLWQLVRVRSQHPRDPGHD